MFGQTHSTIQHTTIRTTPADAIALGRRWTATPPAARETAPPARAL